MGASKTAKTQQLFIVRLLTSSDSAEFHTATQIDGFLSSRDYVIDYVIGMFELCLLSRQAPVTHPTALARLYGILAPLL